MSTFCKFALQASVWGLAAGLVAAAPQAAAQVPGQTLLLRQPAVSRDHLVFVRAGDLWVAQRNGANPRRLTAHPAEERSPFISPDGRFVAFVGEYNRNADVYVVPIEGGQPKRLTFHPGQDVVQGWTPDGRVLFSSAREVNHGRSAQLYSIGLAEAYPTKVMEARFGFGAMKADGKTLAYIPFGPAHNALYGGSSGWRQHRGGTTPSINILDLRSQALSTIPGERVNDLNPLWVGDRIYFLSDRDSQSLALYSFDPASGAIEKRASEGPWDIRWASATDGAIVYEAGGRLKEYDIGTGAVREIQVKLAADVAQLASRWVDVSTSLGDASLSPSGQRALFSGRGEVFTVPTGKEGSTRNLTASGAVREYTPLWSREGDQIAYISDEGGVHALRIEDQRGLAAPRTLALGGDKTAFYQLLAWAPGGKRIVYADSQLNLYALDVASGASTRIDTHDRWSDTEATVSPDGRWVAYTRRAASGVLDIVLYEFESKRRAVVSNGMAFVTAPVFSRDGAYLYFAASTNLGPSQFGLNMQSSERPQRFGLYALVLAADGKSPFLRDTADEEKPKPEAPAAKKGKAEAKPEAAKAAKVDLEGLSGRIVAFPVAERNYDTLLVGEDGALFYIDRPQPGAANDPPGAQNGEAKLMRFDFEKREAKEVAGGVQGAAISADGKKLLLRQNGGKWSTAAIGETLKPEALNVSDARVKIDPQVEWAHIFDETWRMERAYFYDANLHGLDWAGVRARYEPLLAHVSRREDLNALLAEMIGELQVGHNRISGGDVHREQEAPTGLLGADYVIEQGRYRIARIYDGESWNPFLKAPLAEPGLGVKAGDFLIALNGQELTAQDNIHEALQGTVGKQVTLLVNTRPSREGAREIVVEPIDNESQLRLWEWVEGNRRLVEERSGGRVGYIYLPNTAQAGFSFFNRMYFAQADKDGFIFDERANGGGQAADYIVDTLSAQHLSGWKYREGLAFNTPTAFNYGPKVMLIDQDAGSGGDYLPYAFKRRGIGPLIGKRTWGGLIGISANPPLVDGGALTVPFFRFYTPEGEWRIENEGTPPDIDVALDPVATNRGQDTQLERALAEVMAGLEGKGRQAPLAAPPSPTVVGQ